ncbi:MAG: UDP-2,3-diacylglucosamine diphosphatase LpxI [Alphaproteobacteria bacterium]|nr:UDP-2,3-diacylglucosamine diphosphatase LpxI [Alphaproteobacteria bacterium]
MTAKLGVLAGGGTLPAAVVAAARAKGRPVFVLAFQGHTDPTTVMDVEHAWVRLGDVGETFRRLHEAAVRDICLIGHMRRPTAAELRPDLRGMRLLARLGVRAFGDDGLLGGVIREIESEGFRVVGADDVLADILAPEGPVGRVTPSAEDGIDIARGRAVLAALGGVDVGQATIVERGVVLGIEAIEGTDALIDRCSALRREPSGGVLVKMAKPQQERRVDLPTVGVTTVERVARAGFAGIAIEAGRSLLVDRAAVAAAADAAGLFVVGCPGRA